MRPEEIDFVFLWVLFLVIVGGGMAAFFLGILYKWYELAFTSGADIFVTEIAPFFE